MAQTTMALAVTKSGYVKSAFPSTVFITDSATNYIVTNDVGTLNQNRLYFGFSGIPDSLKHNKLYSLQILLDVRPGRPDLDVNYCNDFDPATLTWNTKPEGTTDVASFTGAGSSAPGPWGNQTATVSDAFYVAMLLRFCCLWVGTPTLYTSEGDNWYAKVVLANGDNPSFTLTYDDSVKIFSGAAWIDTSSKKGWITDSTAYSGKEYELSWQLQRASGQSGSCLDDSASSWTQASAVLKWRIQGQSTWTTATSVSGPEQKMTVPASTFPTGQTVEYCVEVTDTEGTVSQTVTKTATFAASQITAQDSPTSGYVNPRIARSFGWYFANGTRAVAAGTVSLYWKDSDDANYTQVTASAGAESLTIAANTFPTGKTIQWYLSGTDFSGASSQTSVYSFSTTAGTAYATAQKPISSVEDGSAPILFTWTLSSTDGQAPSAVDFWWKLPSEDNQHWHAILNQASPVSSYSVPAGTFSAGEIQWIVRAYNVDGTAGPWSTPGTGYYSFICVAAPDPPEGLSATAVPITTISWQSAAQQAYEISIDGTVLQKGFGAGVNSWTVGEPLSGGVHTISVRVQGQYGLWSQPSTVTISVGGPSYQMTISGAFDVDALLSTDARMILNYATGGTSYSINATNGNTASSSVFNYTDYIDVSAFTRIFYKRTKHTQTTTTVGMAFYNASKVYVSGVRGAARQTATGYQDELYEAEVPAGAVYARFSIYADVSTFGDFLAIGVGSIPIRYYRDGSYIGTASGSEPFTDNRVLGTHNYFSRVFLSDGNYQQSDTISGTMSTRFLQVAPLDGSSGWLTLRLSENSADENDFQWSRTQVVQHITGATYPEAELSQFEDLNARYNCAFKDRSEALAFEALRGKAVILKSRGGNVVIGVLSQISKRQTVFYTTYAFTITQIHTRDWTEET